MLISKKIAKVILDDAISTGATYSELFVEETNKNQIIVDCKKLDAVNYSKIKGAGLRIIKGKQISYGYTNDLSLKSLLKLSEQLKAQFTGEKSLEIKSLKQVKYRPINRPLIKHEEWCLEKKVDFLKELGDKIYDKSPLIIRAVTCLLEQDQNIEIYTSMGKVYEDTRSHTRLMMQAVAKRDDNIETSIESPGAQKGLELLNELNLEQLVDQVASSAVSKLDAVPSPSGMYPVILGNGFGGVLFHESCGHSLELNGVSKNLSVFSNKLGTKIASSLVTAIDDGTIDGGWGSLNFDDEGNKPTKNYLIKEGILNSYMVDNFYGKQMNLNSTGACRRENYKYCPTTRMTNTYIDNGTSTVEEIIASTKLGIYAKRLGGGSVNTATGEFNFAVSEGYVVRDGKIVKPIKAATLIGQGKDVLLKIDMIANDLERAEGMCGSSSGSIPADVGQPTLRVSSMTVGGTGGDINEIK